MENSSGIVTFHAVVNEIGMRMHVVYVRINQYIHI